MSTSVGGVLTGRGADLIILDDPLKPDDAFSETRRTAVNEWYDHSLISRLNNKGTGTINGIKLPHSSPPTTRPVARANPFPRRAC